jgi:hypothetical protein
VGVTPRVGKSVHYEDTPPPKPHFPLPPPFNTRLIGFGCPETSVPRDYLGPRRGLWGEAANDANSSRAEQQQRLAEALQAELREEVAEEAAAMARISSYDLSGVTLLSSASAVKQACLVWKTPARRRAMRTLLLSRTHMDDAGLRVLARWVSQAPSAPAPLQLDRLELDDNDLWAPAFAALLNAFADNKAASVATLQANNCHVGALPAPAPGTAASKDHADETGAATPRGQAAAAQATAVATATAAATQYFSPFVSLLSSSHCRLTVLSLCQCSLTDVAAAYLAQGLRSNNTLVELHLDANLLTDASARTIAAALGGRYTEEQAEAAAIAAAAAADAATALAAVSLADESQRPSARPSSRGGGGGAAPRSALSSAGGGGTASNKKKPSGLDTTGAPAATHTKRLSFNLGPGSPVQSPSHKRSGGGGGDAATNHDAATHAAEQAAEVAAAQAIALALRLPGGLAASVPLPTFPSSPRVNTSLVLLSLSRNRLSAVGLAHLEAAVRAPGSSLRLVRAEGQSGVRSIDSSAHALALEVLASRCASNRARNLRATKAAFALGLHPRAGVKSSLATLRLGAAEMATTTAQQLQQQQQSSQLQSNGSLERGHHSQLSNGSLQLPLSQLPLHPSSSSSFSSSSSTSSPSPSPTAALLTAALQDVWAFVGEQ